MAKKITEEAAKAAMKEWLDNDVQLAKVQAEKRVKITPLVQKYEGLERELTDKKLQAAEVLEAYADQNRGTILPSGKKSTGFEGGTIGWKSGPPKLVLANEDEFGWEEVLAMARKVLPEFVLQKDELDKSGILRNADGIGDKLAKAGLAVEQKETFYVKA